MGCIPLPSFTPVSYQHDAKLPRTIPASHCSGGTPPKPKQNRRAEPDRLLYVTKSFYLFPFRCPPATRRILASSEPRKVLCSPPFPLLPNLQVPVSVCEGDLLEVFVRTDKGGKVAGPTSVAEGDGGLEAILRVQ